MQVETGCRVCGSEALETILALGDMPLADALMVDVESSERQPRYPLTLVFCASCSLVQIRETVSPQELFAGDYPYYSSYSPQLLSHARRHAERLMAAEGLNAGSWVVEIASNDGYLLQNFVRAGIPVLGVDPAPGPAATAVERGVATLQEFFSLELAERLRDGGRAADVIIANNVLAHVADTHGVVAGIRCLLAHDGVATLEFPYVRDLVDQCEFDTIYHEHLCYFSLHSARQLFELRGLRVHDVQRVGIHGGSLRLFVSHDRRPSHRVRQLLEEERSIGLTTADYYRGFAARVARLRADLRRLLSSLLAGGKRIAAYGAAAKGATLLNYAGIGADWIDFVVDRNAHKQGRYMPGVPIPISATDRLLSDMPDYVLLLAWNFQQEILRQQAEFLQRGGRFITPVPDPRVLCSSFGDRTSLQPHVA